LPNRKSNKSTATYRIKWEALKDKEVRKKFASSMTTKFRKLPDDLRTSRWNGRCSDQLLNTVGKSAESGWDSEKRTPWWNQDVKEAIRAK